MDSERSRYQVTSWAETRADPSADGRSDADAEVHPRLPLPDPYDMRPGRRDPVQHRPESVPTVQAWRRDVRKEFGWGDEPVLVYSGSLGSWYRLGEMLDFFEVARTESGFASSC